MKTNTWLLALTFLVSGNLLMNIYSSFISNEQIAFVRSHDLVYSYTGMKEMQLKFQEKTQTWESRLDTLKSDYQKTLSEYRLNYDQLIKSEKKSKETLLEYQQNNIAQYLEQMNTESKQQEEEMLEGVLNQVNSFVEEYGKSNGYKLILGTTMDGSILYGNDVIDLTETIIEELNNSYYGE